MPPDTPADRPLGWWLKQADVRLDAAFDQVLQGRDVDRRIWQVLASLAKQPTDRSALTSSLAPFDEPQVIDSVLGDLTDRGWVDESDGVLALTPEGRREQTALAPLAGEVRRQVADALPGDDYATLVKLLSQLVAALETRGREASP